ncbi:MAG TPA: 30S ribosomal protein S8 [Candidatus Acidoferrum sp.]|nr:30S ribosomal protein S8 [Candidatus Methylomirabilis sp.]HWU40533.1 30S ribosomal protein S8 [Candidatus Acidoferrum sp.]
MSMTDPIADMLTRIRNANTALLEKVDIPASRLKIELAKLLKAEGFIRAYKLIDDNKQGILRVYMKFGSGNERVILGLRRVSRPGLRVYRKATQIPNVMSGMGLAVLSTSQGLMSGKAARQRSLGGEVLCYLW